MPHYNVMVFGFQGPQAMWDAAQSLGIVFSHTEEGEEGGYAITDGRTMAQALEDRCLDVATPPAIQARIDALFVQAVNGLPGYAYKGFRKSSFIRSEHVVQTPSGVHISDGLTIHTAFDNFECDDRVEDALLGFYLTSRYTPAFLDLHNSRGGMQGVQRDHQVYIESLIRATFPEWAQARTYIHQLFA